MSDGGPFDLFQGEQVVMTKSANFSQNPQRAVGGKLWLTNRRVLFAPHGFDRALAGESVEIPLARVAEVGKEPVNLRHFFGGGIRARLRIATVDGAVYLFVVNGLHAVIAQIRDAARP